MNLIGSLAQCMQRSIRFNFFFATPYLFTKGTPYLFTKGRNSRNQTCADSRCGCAHSRSPLSKLLDVAMKACQTVQVELLRMHI
jgi:hypothetical protein